MDNARCYGYGMRDTTPTYIVKIIDGRYGYEPFAWLTTSKTQIRADGKPTADNLKRWVESFEAATKPGGVNAHLGETKIRRAAILHNMTRQPVAEYVA